MQIQLLVFKTVIVLGNKCDAIKQKESELKYNENQSLSIAMPSPF